MFRNRPTITLRQVVVGAVIVLAALLLWYLLTHGRLVIPGASNETVVVYTKLGDGINKSPQISNQTSGIVPSGSYSVSISDKFGNRTIQNVDVPRFLFSATVDSKQSAKQTTALSRNSLSNLVVTSEGLSSHEGSAFRKLEELNITNDNLKDYSVNEYPGFIDSNQLSKSVVVGYYEAGSDIQPVRYDTTSGLATSYPAISDVDIQDISLINTTDRFLVFNKKQSVLYTYELGSTASTALELESAANVSSVDGMPVLSANDTQLAFSTGPDYASSNDIEQELIGGNHTVQVINLKSREKISSFSFSSAQIQNLALSPQGRYIAISSDAQTGIYDIETTQLLMVIPHSVETFRWVDDDRYILTTRTEGIFSGTVTSASSSTLVSYDDVRPTAVSFVDNGNLYFTGYSNTRTNAEYPDAFRVSLEKPASAIDQVKLRYFPHQGEGFYVDCLNNIITVQLTRYVTGGVNSVDSTAKQAAQTYINNKLPSYPLNAVRYQYIDFDF